MTQNQWDFVRQACYVAADHRCEICNGRGRKHPVECHEVWEYDDKKRTQTLLRTIALCPSCHQVKHIGLQMKRGMEYFQRAIDHFIKVNKISEQQAEDYIMTAFAQHNQRSKVNWAVDVSWIERRHPTYFKRKPLKIGEECNV